MLVPRADLFLLRTTIRARTASRSRRRTLKGHCWATHRSWSDTEWEPPGRTRRRVSVKH